MAFRRMIPALTQLFRDRYLLVGGLHAMDQAPPAMLHVPALLVLHGKEARPEERHPEHLRLAERVGVEYTCRGERYPMWLSLTLPRKPVLAPPPDPSPHHGR